MSALLTLERSADALLQRKAEQGSMQQQLERRSANVDRDLRQASFTTRTVLADSGRRRRELDDVVGDRAAADAALQRSQLKLRALGDAVRDAQTTAAATKEDMEAVSAAAAGVGLRVARALRQLRDLSKLRILKRRRVGEARRLLHLHAARRVVLSFSSVVNQLSDSIRNTWCATREVRRGDLIRLKDSIASAQAAVGDEAAKLSNTSLELRRREEEITALKFASTSLKEHHHALSVSLAALRQQVTKESETVATATNMLRELRSVHAAQVARRRQAIEDRARCRNELSDMARALTEKTQVAAGALSWAQEQLAVKQRSVACGREATAAKVNGNVALTEALRALKSTHIKQVSVQTQLPLLRGAAESELVAAQEHFDAAVAAHFAQRFATLVDEEGRLRDCIDGQNDAAFRSFKTAFTQNAAIIALADEEAGARASMVAAATACFTQWARLAEQEEAAREALRHALQTPPATRPVLATAAAAPLPMESSAQAKKRPRKPATTAEGAATPIQPVSTADAAASVLTSPPVTRRRAPPPLGNRSTPAVTVRTPATVVAAMPKVVVEDDDALTPPTLPSHRGAPQDSNAPRSGALTRDPKTLRSPQDDAWQVQTPAAQVRGASMSDAIDTASCAAAAAADRSGDRVVRSAARPGTVRRTLEWTPSQSPDPRRPAIVNSDLFGPGGVALGFHSFAPTTATQALRPLAAAPAAQPVVQQHRPPTGGGPSRVGPAGVNGGRLAPPAAATPSAHQRTRPVTAAHEPKKATATRAPPTPLAPAHTKRVDDTLFSDVFTF